MLIERKPIAVKALSVRTDQEAYDGILSMSEALDSPSSVLLRLAISDLIQKQKRLNAKTLEQLMQHQVV